MSRCRVLLIGGPDVDARIDMIRILNDEFEFVVIGTNNNLDEIFSDHGIEYSKYSMSRGINPISDILALVDLTRKIRKIDPDIVHTFDTKPSVLGRIAAHFAGSRNIVGTIPGLGYLYSNNNFTTFIKRVPYERLQKLACSYSDFTIFQNPDDIQEYINREIVGTDQVKLIPGSGVNTSKYDIWNVGEKKTSTFREELSIDMQKPIVTMVSRLIKSKGVLDFAKAAMRLKFESTDAVFLLVGPYDSDSPDALNAPELRNVTKSLLWTGPRSDIPIVLASSQIFVLPSYYREGIPRTLMEAGAIGLPMIAVDSPGNREVVRSGENGYLVPPKNPAALADAIKDLLSNPAKRSEFGKHAREYVRNTFGISRIADEHRTMYRSLTES